VFPDTDDFPTGVAESLISVGIAPFVSVDLGGPKLGRRSGRLPVVIRTAMPKTPIQEHRYLRPRKDEVRSTPDIR
jgi:hypothetical protein